MGSGMVWCGVVVPGELMQGSWSKRSCGGGEVGHRLKEHVSIVAAKRLVGIFYAVVRRPSVVW
jgi:hypothetical protein